ncbi:Ig-like domain-containing protein, partial [Listeria seeligeri]|uniref:hypothetical protein n=1 Tax=Listeria seeligeri TaxID=1640 RepID=UPI0018891807
MKRIIMLICLLISFCIPVQALAADPPVINSLEGATPFGGNASYPDADEAFYPVQWRPYSLNVTTTPADATVSFEVVKMTMNDSGVIVPAPSQDPMGAAITPNNEFYFLGGDEHIYLLKVTAEANGLSTTKNYYALCGGLDFPRKNVTVGESTDISIQSPMDSVVFSYSTADPSIAQVSSDGILTGVSPGTTQFFMTATYLGEPYTNSVTVVVNPAALTPPIISVNKNDITYPIN